MIAAAEIRAAKALLATARREQRRARPAKVAPIADGQRRPRVRDGGYLAFLRRQPCVVGPIGCDGPTEAAHVRMGVTGMGRKPDDQNAVSLCAAHHRTGPDAQHASGERQWWSRHGLDPFAVAERLYAEYQGANT
jgi:hypothetical protein